jgi:two-component system, OmpR family, phosphate regulon sensor histidine kinase PhoR
MSDSSTPTQHDPLHDEIEKLRAENAALRAQIGDLTKTTNEYLQNVAHQLTAPLNAMKWDIEALRKPEVPLGRKNNILSSLYSQGTILVHLIKNFALMSNLEADLELGQFRDKPEKVDVLRLAINLANDFQSQAAEGAKKIEVDDASFSTELGGRQVLAVKNLIAQALSNLLENAVKYSDLRTTIVISAVKIPLKDKSSAFGISVLSSGIPLPPKEISKLPERGFRGAGAKAKVPAGTGIGLYLAKRIMALHQGNILIHGRNQESQFILAFPAKRLV